MEKIISTKTWLMTNVKKIYKASLLAFPKCWIWVVSLVKEKFRKYLEPNGEYVRVPQKFFSHIIYFFFAFGLKVKGWQRDWKEKEGGGERWAGEEWWERMKGPEVIYNPLVSSGLSSALWSPAGFDLPSSSSHLLSEKLEGPRVRAMLVLPGRTSALPGVLLPCLLFYWG